MKAIAATTRGEVWERLVLVEVISSGDATPRGAFVKFGTKGDLLGLIRPLGLPNGLGVTTLKAIHASSTG